MHHCSESERAGEDSAARDGPLHHDNESDLGCAWRFGIGVFPRAGIGYESKKVPGSRVFPNHVEEVLHSSYRRHRSLIVGLRDFGAMLSSRG